MYVIFFNYSGVVSSTKLISAPGKRSINAEFYVEKCLQKVIKALKKKRPKSGTQGIFLHHDNASPHKARLTRDFFTSEGLKILPHPPYSPDLSPCDFFLFPKLKSFLRGKTFGSQKQLDSAVGQRLREISKDQYLSAFQSWVARCRKCIGCEGDYFEGIRKQK